MPARLVVVLDADVLVPILSCDLLLTAFEHDLYQPVVTPRILAEVEHTLLDDFAHLDPAAILRRSAHVAAALRLHTLEGSPITSAVDAVNAKDRHVATAALVAKADLVVTNDRRLGRQINQLAGGSRAVNADEFMVSLSTADPDAIDAVLAGMVAKRTRRPITRAGLIEQLAAAFPRFTARANRREENG